MIPTPDEGSVIGTVARMHRLAGSLTHVTGPVIGVGDEIALVPDPYCGFTMTMTGVPLGTLVASTTTATGFVKIDRQRHVRGQRIRRWLHGKAQTTD
jgi:hypothetical protein